MNAMGSLSDPVSTESALSDSILALLAARAPGATICPSEAARAVHAASSATDPDGWRDLMEPSRAAARRLVTRGEVVITQRGAVVDPDTATGPIRIRRTPRGD
jgi:hypothetical protein